MLSAAVRYMLSPVCPSVYPSGTPVDQ